MSLLLALEPLFNDIIHKSNVNNVRYKGINEVERLLIDFNITWLTMYYGVCWIATNRAAFEQAKQAMHSDDFAAEHTLEKSPYMAALLLSSSSPQNTVLRQQQAIAFMNRNQELCQKWYEYNDDLDTPLLKLNKCDCQCFCLPRHERGPCPTPNKEKEIQRRLRRREKEIAELRLVDQTITKQVIHPPLYTDNHGCQNDITERMRATLFVWLNEVIRTQSRLTNKRELYYLTTSLTDRYLAITEPIDRTVLQLVGTSALLVAGNIHNIQLDETWLSGMTGKAYTPEEILRRSFDIIARLDSNLNTTTCVGLLEEMLQIINASEMTTSLAHYYAEYNVQYGTYLMHKPHDFCCAVIYCALKQQYGEHANHLVWPLQYSLFFGLSEDNLLPCAREIVKNLSKELKRVLGSIRKKYSTEEYHYAATRPLPKFE